MADGIRIEDVAVDISPGSLQGLISREGGEIRVTRLNLSLSQEALNVLLSRAAPEGGQPPTARVSDGRLLVTTGQAVALDLQVGGFRVELTADGIRLVSGTDNR